MPKSSFGSDNHSGIHPQILQALSESNSGHDHSYEGDQPSKDCQKIFRSLFGPSVQSYAVLNGTAANVLALASLIQSHHSVLCSEDSHLNVDECGAPEKNIGCKLIPIKSHHGKIHPKDLLPALIRQGDQHYSQVKALSITQPTEMGALYSYEELLELSEFCQTHQLFFHIDGARFIYAPYLLKKTFKELTVDLKVDALSFGGTKNGLFLCEQVLLFNEEANRHFRFLRKQMMQLPSKTRFLSAQWKAFFSTDSEGTPLWERIAQQGHEKALYLANKIEAAKSLKIVAPVQANSVFVQLPKAWTKELKRSQFFYIWDEKKWVARLMMSFDTQKQDIDDFMEIVNQLERKERVNEI